MRSSRPLYPSHPPLQEMQDRRSAKAVPVSDDALVDTLRAEISQLEGGYATGGEGGY